MKEGGRGEGKRKKRQEKQTRNIVRGERGKRVKGDRGETERKKMTGKHTRNKVRGEGRRGTHFISIREGGGGEKEAEKKKKKQREHMRKKKEKLKTLKLVEKRLCGINARIICNTNNKQEEEKKKNQPTNQPTNKPTNNKTGKRRKKTTHPAAAADAMPTIRCCWCCAKVSRPASSAWGREGGRG